MVAALLAQENGLTSNWLKKLSPFSNQQQCLGMSNQSYYEPLRLLTAVLRNVQPKRLRTQGRIQDFFYEGVHSSLASTSTPINHIVFFLQNTSCIRKPQVISGGGGGEAAHPLHSPPRSAPGTTWSFNTCVNNSIGGSRPGPPSNS